MEQLKTDFSYSTLRSIFTPGFSTKTAAKALWALPLLGCLAVFALFVAQSFVFFFSYPIGTTTKIHNGPLEFPAVSACNLNPYKVSALKSKAPQIYRSLQEYSAKIIADEKATRSKRQAGFIERQQSSLDTLADVKSMPVTIKAYDDWDQAAELHPIVRHRRAAAAVDDVPDNIGKVFYTAFAPNSYPSNRQLVLATTNPSPFNVTITTRDNSFKRVQLIDNKQVYVVTYTTGSSIGTKLIGDFDFTVYSILFEDEYSAGGFLVFPLDVLGTDHILISPEDPNKDINIVIVGTESGTTVTATFPGGSTQTKNIGEMDVAAFGNRADQTGTRITSNKPVAVISSVGCLSYPVGCDWCDHAVEQLAPTNRWGMRFPLVPFDAKCVWTPTCCANGTFCPAKAPFCYEVFKVVAFADGTTINRHGSVTNELFKLNAREWRTVLVEQTEYSYLVADKPLQVVHIMTGTIYQDKKKETSPTDPALLMIPPTDGFTNTYFIVSCNPAFTDHYLQIIIDESQSDGLLLNNKTFLASTPAHQIPTTTLSAYHYRITCGSKAQSFLISHKDVHVLFGVIASGLANAASYAYMAGARLGNGSYFCNPTTDSNPPDGVDNDCDGWVDEELRNFIDDDNDGRIDEDLAAAIPLISVADSQITTCDLDDIPLPLNNSQPDLPEVYIDERCSPPNLTYVDSNVSGNNCTTVISRLWRVIDACGNIGDNVTQVITLVAEQDQYSPPPTAYLNTTADLSDGNTTGIPSVVANCSSPAPWSYSYSDQFVNSGYVNRTWIIQPQCSNGTVALLQDIFIADYSTTTTTTTSTVQSTTTDNCTTTGLETTEMNSTEYSTTELPSTELDNSTTVLTDSTETGTLASATTTVVDSSIATTAAESAETSDAQTTTTGTVTDMQTTDSETRSQTSTISEIRTTAITVTSAAETSGMTTASMSETSVSSSAGLQSTSGATSESPTDASQEFSTTSEANQGTTSLVESTEESIDHTTSETQPATTSRTGSSKATETTMEIASTLDATTMATTDTEKAITYGATSRESTYADGSTVAAQMPTETVARRDATATETSGIPGSAASTNVASANSAAAFDQSANAVTGTTAYSTKASYFTALDSTFSITSGTVADSHGPPTSTTASDASVVSSTTLQYPSSAITESKPMSTLGPPSTASSTGAIPTVIQTEEISDQLSTIAKAPDTVTPAKIGSSTSVAITSQSQTATVAGTGITPIKEVASAPTSRDSLFSDILATLSPLVPTSTTTGFRLTASAATTGDGPSPSASSTAFVESYGSGPADIETTKSSSSSSTTTSTTTPSEQSQTSPAVLSTKEPSVELPLDFSNLETSSITFATMASVDQRKLVTTTTETPVSQTTAAEPEPLEFTVAYSKPQAQATAAVASSTSTYSSADVSSIESVAGPQTSRTLTEPVETSTEAIMDKNIGLSKQTFDEATKPTSVSSSSNASTPAVATVAPTSPDEGLPLNPLPTPDYLDEPVELANLAEGPTDFDEYSTTRRITSDSTAANENTTIFETTAPTTGSGAMITADGRAPIAPSTSTTLTVQAVAVPTGQPDTTRRTVGNTMASTPAEAPGTTASSGFTSPTTTQTLGGASSASPVTISRTSSITTIEEEEQEDRQLQKGKQLKTDGPPFELGSGPAIETGSPTPAASSTGLYSSSHGSLLGSSTKSSTETAASIAQIFTIGKPITIGNTDGQTSSTPSLSASLNSASSKATSNTQGGTNAVPVNPSLSSDDPSTPMTSEGTTQPAHNPLIESKPTIQQPSSQDRSSATSSTTALDSDWLTVDDNSTYQSRTPTKGSSPSRSRTASTSVATPETLQTPESSAVVNLSPAQGNLSPLPTRWVPSTLTPAASHVSTSESVLLTSQPVAASAVPTAAPPEVIPTGKPSIPQKVANFVWSSFLNSFSGGSPPAPAPVPEAPPVLTTTTSASGSTTLSSSLSSSAKTTDILANFGPSAGFAPMESGKQQASIQESGKTDQDAMAPLTNVPLATGGTSEDSPRHLDGYSTTDHANLQPSTTGIGTDLNFSPHSNANQPPMVASQSSTDKSPGHPPLSTASSSQSQAIDENQMNMSPNSSVQKQENATPSVLPTQLPIRDRTGGPVSPTSPGTALASNIALPTRQQEAGDGADQSTPTGLFGQRQTATGQLETPSGKQESVQGLSAQEPSATSPKQQEPSKTDQITQQSMSNGPTLAAQDFAASTNHSEGHVEAASQNPSSSDAPPNIQGAPSASPPIALANTKPYQFNINDSIVPPSDGEMDLMAWSSQMQDALAYYTKENDPDGTIASLLGYQLDEFIFWCRYTGEKCDLVTEVKRFSDANYGNCFTFNWNPKSHFASRAGQRLGLRLIFNTPSDDTLPFILPAGFALSFHQADEDPMIQTLGTKGSPGVHYIFGVRKGSTQKLGDPYSPCTSSISDSRLNFYANTSYSIETCLGTCHQKSLLARCNCGDPHYPLPVADPRGYCNISQKSCVDSFSAVSSDYVSLNACGCKPACSASDFHYVETKALWPTGLFVPPKCNGETGADFEDCRNAFKSSYSRIDIYFSSMVETTVHEFAPYTLWNLASDIFANVGFWLGCCIISLAELILFPAIAVATAFASK